MPNSVRRFLIPRDRGNNLKQIADDAIMGKLENRRFLILVDRNDDIRMAHTDRMLHSAGDADGEV